MLDKTAKHGNVKVSSSDIRVIKNLFDDVDAAIVKLKQNKKQILSNYNITIGTYRKKLREMGE